MMRFVTPLLLAATVALPLSAKTLPARAGAQMTTTLSSADYDCDTLAINHGLDRSVLRDLKPAHSIDAAAAVLARHGIKYRRVQATLSLTDVPQSVLETINRTPQGEPFILPDEDSSAICVLMPSADSI